MKDHSVRTGRRGFLKGLAVAGGGAAVAGLAGTTQAATPTTEVRLQGEAEAGKGYSETAHVREYYAKARF